MLLTVEKLQFETSLSVSEAMDRILGELAQADPGRVWPGLVGAVRWVGKVSRNTIFLRRTYPCEFVESVTVAPSLQKYLMYQVTVKDAGKLRRVACRTTLRWQAILGHWAPTAVVASVAVAAFFATESMAARLVTMLFLGVLAVLTSYVWTGYKAAARRELEFLHALIAPRAKSLSR